MLEFLYKQIFGIKCLNCGVGNDFICKNCRDLLEPHLIKKSESCYFIFRYHGLVRKIIKRSKFGGRYHAYLKYLSKFAAEFLKRKKVSFLDYLIIPIPTSYSGLRKRGFNQTEIIAKVFSVYLGGKVDVSILSRIKETKHLFDQSRENRRIIMKGAFFASEKAKGKRIVLIDDIVTTGSTFVEAKKALYTAGAKTVIAIALSGNI